MKEADNKERGHTFYGGMYMKLKHAACNNTVLPNQEDGVILFSYHNGACLDKSGYFVTHL